MAKQPKGKSFGEGPPAFTKQQTPAGSSKVPPNTRASGNRPEGAPIPSGQRVPSWRK